MVNLAAVEIIDDTITGSIFHAYLNPEGKKSAKGAFDVHQLRDSFLSEQPLFGSVADELIEFIGDAELSFYNRNFDMSFLQSEFDKCGYDAVFSRDYKSSCLMKDFADKENYGKWLKLDAACVMGLIFPNEKRMELQLTLY
ncbi:MAG: DNA polymerase III epsilon subunit-like protein [Glaciecola sp.]